MRYLLDEDVNPKAAVIARGRGLEAVSVQELERFSLEDEHQLRFAAREGRVFVTRNRDDFRRLTVDFFEAREPHAGVLVLPFSIPNNRPEQIASALERYEKRSAGDHMQPYTFDFLQGEPDG